MGRVRKSRKTFMGLSKADDTKLFAYCKKEGISVKKFTRDAITEKLSRQ